MSDQVMILSHKALSGEAMMVEAVVMGGRTHTTDCLNALLSRGAEWYEKGMPWESRAFDGDGKAVTSALQKCASRRSYDSQVWVVYSRSIVGQLLDSGVPPDEGAHLRLCAVFGSRDALTSCLDLVCSGRKSDHRIESVHVDGAEFNQLFNELGRNLP